MLDEKLEADSPKANGVTNGTNGAVGDISMETINSDLDSERPVDSDAASDTPGSNHTTNGRITSNRQRALHLKSQSIATAKQRAIARTKAAEAKATLAERRKLDEELNKHEKRLEGIEREFRKLLGVSRARPLGKDRFHNRVWWFDGMGGGTLVAGGGQVAWGTGRIFFQGPSDADLDLMRGKGDEVEVRRVEEEGEEGMLAPGEWAYFSKTEQVGRHIFVICCVSHVSNVGFVVQVEEYLAWLNLKGNRELALKNALVKWMDHILPGMRKRYSVGPFFLSLYSILVFLSLVCVGYDDELAPGREAKSSRKGCIKRSLPRTVHGLDESQSCQQHLIPTTPLTLLL